MPSFTAPIAKKLSALLWKSRADDQVLTAAELHRQYLPAVLAYVIARIGVGDQAEDVTAEVFGAAFKYLQRCPRHSESDDADPVRAWLFGIARRKVADVYRRRKRRSETVLEPGIPAPTRQGPEARILADEAAQMLQAILEGLPELQREALRLKYLEELSLIEIGLVLGKSPAAVGQLLHRARQTVRLRGDQYFGPTSDCEERSR